MPLVSYGQYDHQGFDPQAHHYDDMSKHVDRLFGGLSQIHPLMQAQVMHPLMQAQAMHPLMQAQAMHPLLHPLMQAPAMMHTELMHPLIRQLMQAQVMQPLTRIELQFDGDQILQLRFMEIEQELLIKAMLDNGVTQQEIEQIKATPIDGEENYELNYPNAQTHEEAHIREVSKVHDRVKKHFWTSMHSKIDANMITTMADKLMERMEAEIKAVKGEPQQTNGRHSMVGPHSMDEHTYNNGPLQMGVTLPHSSGPLQMGATMALPSNPHFNPQQQSFIQQQTPHPFDRSGLGSGLNRLGNHIAGQGMQHLSDHFDTVNSFAKQMHQDPHSIHNVVHDNLLSAAELARRHMDMREKHMEIAANALMGDHFGSARLQPHVGAIFGPVHDISHAMQQHPFTKHLMGTANGLGHSIHQHPYMQDMAATVNDWGNSVQHYLQPNSQHAMNSPPMQEQFQMVSILA